jgi:hypothetical protein
MYNLFRRLLETCDENLNTLTKFHNEETTDKTQYIGVLEER